MKRKGREARSLWEAGQERKKGAEKRTSFSVCGGLKTFVLLREGRKENFPKTHHEDPSAEYRVLHCGSYPKNPYPKDSFAEQGSACCLLFLLKCHPLSWCSPAPSCCTSSWLPVPNCLYFIVPQHLEPKWVLPSQNHFIAVWIALVLAGLAFPPLYSHTSGGKKGLPRQFLGVLLWVFYPTNGWNRGCLSSVNFLLVPAVVCSFYSRDSAVPTSKARAQSWPSQQCCFVKDLLSCEITAVSKM